MNNLVTFPEKPAIGTVVTLDKVQHYELIATEPYTRKDGGTSALLTWRVNCHNCGQPFEFKTGLASKAWNRRCKGCASPLRRISGRHRKRKRIDVCICSPVDLF